jgi:hypothetical protein
MVDDFVDRLAGRAEIEKVVHRTHRIRRTLSMRQSTYLALSNGKFLVPVAY